MRLFARKGSPFASDTPGSPPGLDADLAPRIPGTALRRFGRRWLGLDIGSSAVKVVELSRLRETYRVESFAVEPVPPGSVVAGNISDAGAVGETIRRAVKRAGAKTSNVCIGIGSSAVITKSIDVDASLNDAEMEAEITLEADRAMPIPIDEVAIDFEPLHLSPRDPSKVEVLLAACRMEHVTQRQEAAEAAGLTPRIADIDSHAARHALAFVADNTLPLAWADIGATRCSVTLLASDQSIFTREEQLELRGGPGIGVHGARQNGLEDSSAEYLLGLLARLLRLVVLASPLDRVDRLLLAGGAASTPGLAARADERLGMTVEVVDPFAGMPIAGRVDPGALAAQAPALLTACGLALRGFAGTRT